MSLPLCFAKNTHNLATRLLPLILNSKVVTRLLDGCVLQGCNNRVFL